jgi:hypothetical protein
MPLICKQCAECGYWRRLGSGNGVKACHYGIDHDHSRPDNPTEQECSSFATKEEVAEYQHKKQYAERERTMRLTASQREKMREQKARDRDYIYSVILGQGRFKR